MGAYLSEPVTEKHSSEDSSDSLVVGASSMQGWRVNQEDAHNTVLKFDKGMQLFAVYDGHGGAEVATYCSQKLPDFIRESEAYKKGDLEEALKQAFLDLDSSLTKEEVVAELCKLACRNESDAEDEDENVVASLRQEASMPLEDLMAKYQSNAPLKKLQAADGKSPLSPLIRRSGGSGSAGCSSSTDDSGPSCSGAGGSSSGAGPSSSGAGPSSSGEGSSSSGEASSSSAAGSSSEAKNATPGGSSSDAGASNSSSAVSSSVSAEGKENEPVPDPSESVKKEEKEEEETKSKEAKSITKESNGQSEEKDVKPQVNGDVPHIKEETVENADAVSSTTENSALKNGKLHEEEETKPKGKGKAKDKTKSIKKEDEEIEEKKPGRNRTTPIRKLSSMHVLKFLTGEDISDSEESEDDEEEDTSFEGRFESSDDEEDGEGEGEEEDDEDDEDEEDFEDTDSEDENDPIMKMTGLNEVPGSDSGCTAVVALLRGRDLFVANAGDSRCVVCRNGKAIDMSLDHKPEDAPELARILKAGGQVTCDGRVNGGLNLSRAIGDHAYKQVKDIEATEQMITALPDVRTLRIDPKQDDFMVLACDGIWNFMSSQDVCDFVRTRLVDKKMKPAKICEELFDHCLSPNTMGDGTGCDNMTAVIVQFQPALEKEPSTLERETILESPITNETSKKGDEPAEDVDMAKEKEKEEEEDCEDETKEKIEEGEEVVAKKRPSESSENDTEGNLSPKQKKVKVDSDSEANGVQV